MTEDKNEFEELAQTEGLNDDFSETAPTNEYNETPGEDESLISEGNTGQKYDWSKAPEGRKAPPRVGLNGQTVTIKEADITLPPAGREWALSRDGKVKFKYCTFTIFYDKENQQENYSGLRVFEREGKYSHPSFTRDRNNQLSNLIGLYADFRSIDINEVNLKEFMGFLNSKPKAVIKTESVINPTNNEKIEKNFIEKFVA